MSVKPRIGLTQKQKLTLTPAMRSALSLLRMPTDQLIEEIAREAAENPFLEVRESATGSAYDFALATVAGRDSLSVSLARQIDLQRLDGDTRKLAHFLIFQLREDGYLDVALEDLARDHALALAGLQNALTALQRCEPTGVGARNLAECLLLQLIDRGYQVAQAQGIVAHLEDFAEDRLNRVMRTLSLSREQVVRISRDVRSLVPEPVAGDSGWVIPRVPELLAEVSRDGRIEISLNPEALPTVTLLDIGRGRHDSEALRLCYDRALNVTRGLSARAATLLRIGQQIVQSQSGFFLSNHMTIRPESRAAAAAAMGMHASTFGRALAGKSLAVEGKVFALSHFFSRALPAAGGAVSAFDVQVRLRAIIAAEDRRSPLADTAICGQLQHEGVDIARRTVAKYRKCMRIPSSFERRRRNLSEPAGSNAKPK